jgi:hypothetical protein
MQGKSYRLLKPGLSKANRSGFGREGQMAAPPSLPARVVPGVADSPGMPRKTAPEALAFRRVDGDVCQNPSFLGGCATFHRPELPTLAMSPLCRVAIWLFMAI